MSIMEELAEGNITAEDLEKAASVRLFEQACEDEEINLDELTDDQVEELYEYWASGGEEKTAEAEAEADEAQPEDVEEATAKLAEVEILGQHMAEAFWGRLMEKEAAGEQIFGARSRGEQPTAANSAFNKGSGAKKAKRSDVVGNARGKMSGRAASLCTHPITSIGSTRGPSF